MMIDLGDQANSNIFGEGDKITVHGSKMTVKGKKLIDATRLSVNGEQLWNAQSIAKPEKSMSSG